MRVFTVTSGKGGVGKTSLSANLGIGIVQSGARCVLFDADLQLANLDVALGIHPEFTLQHVVAGERALAEVLCPGPGGIQVIAGGSAVSTLMAAGPKRMATFMSQLEDLSDIADYLLFDTSAGLDNRVMTFCRNADEIVVVTTPDPASVTDAYATMKIAHKRAPEIPVGVIVNMVGSDMEAAMVFRSLAEIARRFLGKPIRFLGSISMDPGVAACTRKRVPFLIGAPECQASGDIRGVVSKLRSQTFEARKAA